MNEAMKKFNNPWSKPQMNNLVGAPFEDEEASLIQTSIDSWGINETSETSLSNPEDI